ncbi:MAG TPA: hypothetical protein VGM29_10940 [Polyangiaceae bacterium]
MRLRSVGLLMVGGLVVLGGIVAGVHYSGTAAPSSSALPAEELAALGIPEPGSSALTANSAAPGAEPATLSDEIVAIKPLISDTAGPLDRGSASLALWASKNLTWSALRALPATSPALFRKDPDEERGKLLCIEGTIDEIRAEKNLARRLTTDKAAPLVEGTNGGSNYADRVRLVDHVDGGDAGGLVGLGGSVDDAEWVVPGGKVFFAMVVEPDKNKNDELRGRTKAFTVEALAVKSTGSLVDGDTARFCGILTGVSSSGDGRLVHRAVGMFELPDNTGVSAARAVAAPAAAPPASAP